MNLVEIDSKHDVDLDGIKFCIRALNLKERRVHISHIMVSRGFMYGTDGRRLHGYELHRELNPGIYRVLRNLKNNIILYKTNYSIKKNYPAIKDVLSKKHTSDCFQSECNKEHHMHAATKIIRQLPEDRSINIEYIKDVGDYGCDISVIEDMIIITIGRKKAIIMPTLN